MSFLQVFFCTSMENLSFRPATEPDFLGTQSRQYILGQLQDHEVDLELILGNITTAESGQLVLTDAKNDLNELQKKGAIEHFSGRFGHIVCPAGALSRPFQSCNPCCRNQFGTRTELGVGVFVCVDNLCPVSLIDSPPHNWTLRPRKL